MTGDAEDYLDALEKTTDSPRLLAAIRHVRETMEAERAQDSEQLPELHRLRWTHPRRGEVVEVLCEQHRRQVTGAWKTLGIGGTGERVGGGACIRCAADAIQVEPRVLLGLVGW